MRPGRLWLFYVALMAVSALAAIGIERLFFDIGGSTAEPAKPAMVLARATADDGITANPALSSDGALLAYASDRAGMDNLDIWVQQTAGSAPFQLTHEAVDEIEPAFSPDGSRLAYRSERDGGGIYIVPTFGGQEPRLLVPGGRRPRFSPDGNLIAYWTGTNVGFANSSGSYRTFVIPASGGAAREIRGFTGARYPVWSPDGQSLLLLGSRDPRPLAATYDWWRAPLDGAAPIRVRANELLRRAGIAFDSGNIAPDDWRGDRVLLSDNTYLWSVRLDSGTTTASSVDRLTFGTNRDIQATTAASGLIAFSSASVTNSVWALPIDPVRGVVTGAPRRLTAGAGFDARPSATRDGQLVAYRTEIPRPSILIRNLKTQSIIDVGVPGSGFGPAISPDGTYVAYEDGGGVQVVSTRGGAPRTLCQPCQIGDWSADSRAVVVVKAREQCRSPDVDQPERLVDAGPHRQRRSDGEPAISEPRWTPSGIPARRLGRGRDHGCAPRDRATCPAAGVDRARSTGDGCPAVWVVARRNPGVLRERAGRDTVLVRPACRSNQRGPNRRTFHRPPFSRRSYRIHQRTQCIVHRPRQRHRRWCLLLRSQRLVSEHLDDVGPVAFGARRPRPLPRSHAIRTC